VGPTTTVQVHCSAGPRLEVRTEGQAIAELGRRVANLVLTQEQWNLLHTNSPRVCITGFFGTGEFISFLKSLLTIHSFIMTIYQGFKTQHFLQVKPSCWFFKAFDGCVRDATFVLNQLKGSTLPWSELIVHQLRALMTAKTGEASPVVSLYPCDLYKGGEAAVTRAVKELTEFAEAHGSQLCILVDECAFKRE
jgi:hypothetical protein